MSATIVVPGARPTRELPVGPWWQTAALAALFLGLAAAGAAFQRGASHAGAAPLPHGPAASVYLSVIAAEWALVYWIWRGGLRRTGTTLRELIGPRWSGWGEVARDAALAAGLWAVWIGIQLLWSRLLGPGEAVSIRGMMPRDPVELILWVALSVTAGICEETIFRGYFQRQFAVLARSASAGVALQAALFGVAHGYQGAGATVRIALYGALYGLLAVWRRSLRPGMIAHAWSDIAPGIFGI